MTKIPFPLLIYIYIHISLFFFNMMDFFSKRSQNNCKTFKLANAVSSETVDATELAFSFLVGSNGILQSRTLQTSVTSSDLLNNNRGLSIRDSIFGGSKCLTGTASTILWSFSFRSYSFCRSLKRQIKIMFPISERRRQATNGTMMIQFISETKRLLCLDILLSPELARASTVCVTFFVDFFVTTLGLDLLVGKVVGNLTSSTGACVIEFVVRSIVDPGFVERTVA